MTKELFLPSKPRYDILDGLRGVAALVILLYHVLEGCGVVLGHGYLGVDFFYVLSGFVIGYAYDDRWGRMSAGGFFKRRIIRLHPMVIMGTAIGLAVPASGGDGHGQSLWDTCCTLRKEPLTLQTPRASSAHATAGLHTT